MGYADHDPPPESADGSQALRVLGAAFNTAVRLIGVGLLLVGLWVAIEVVIEAWALYRDPQRIAHLAHYIAEGTGIDALLAASVGADPEAAGPRLRLSVLLAWFVAPVLLFTAGTLAMSAVRTGGLLALGRAAPLAKD